MRTNPAKSGGSAMNARKRRTGVLFGLLLFALVCLVPVTAEGQSVSQLIEQAAANNADAFNQLVALRPSVVPEIQRAFDERWPYHAYISQRTNLVRVLAAMNHIETVPALK